jgi:hypothetical protein
VYISLAETFYASSQRVSDFEIKREHGSISAADRAIPSSVGDGLLPSQDEEHGREDPLPAK